MAHLGTGDILSGPFTQASPFYNWEVKPRPVIFSSLITPSAAMTFSHVILTKYPRDSWPEFTVNFAGA